MGVGGFWSFLRSHAAGCFHFDDESPLRLEGRRLCVDGAMLLTASLKISLTLEEEEAWRPAFVRSVLRRIEVVLRLTGRMPLVVLDGDHPSSKSHAHQQRAKARAASEQRLAQCIAAGDLEGTLRAKRAVCRVTPRLEALAIGALEAAGVPVERAPAEAEDRCAEMCLAGEAWGVVGEDGDTLICGAPWLLRGVCQGGRLCLVARDAMLRELDLSPVQLRWLAALSGTDFHPGVPQVGPARARKLVLPHPDPGDSLAALVKDASLHAGLRGAAEQFGHWGAAPPPSPLGATEATLEELQHRSLASAMARAGGGGGLDWGAAARRLGWPRDLLTGLGGGFASVVLVEEE